MMPFTCVPYVVLVLYVLLSYVYLTPVKPPESLHTLYGKRNPIIKTHDRPLLQPACTPCKVYNKRRLAGAEYFASNTNGERVLS